MKGIANWIHVSSGYLAIGGRPSMQSIERLKAEQCTTIVTLLRQSEKNYAEEVGYKAKSLGITWIWLPLSASDLPQGDDSLKHVIIAMQTVKDKLENGERIYIHCAAGIHRTGAFTYGLLRYLNHSSEAAKEIITRLRPITVQQAVPKHWQWGEQFGKD